MYIVYAINYWYMYLYRFIGLVDIVKVYGYLSPTTPPPSPMVYKHVSAEKFLNGYMHLWKVTLIGF